MVDNKKRIIPKYCALILFDDAIGPPKGVPKKIGVLIDVFGVVSTRFKISEDAANRKSSSFDLSPDSLPLINYSPEWYHEEKERGGSEILKRSESTIYGKDEALLLDFFVNDLKITWNVENEKFNLTLESKNVTLTLKSWSRDVRPIP